MPDALLGAFGPQAQAGRANLIGVPGIASWPRMSAG